MKLGDLIKGGAQEGKEKHVPVIERASCKECGESAIKVTVGKEVAHTNTVEHHIKWIALFGVKNGVAVHIATFDLGPTYGKPAVVTHANVDGLTDLVAIEYCNIHGLWEGSLKL